MTESTAMTGDQRAALSAIETAWAVVRNADERHQSRFVVLSGEPGCGKTAVVSEFYRRLVATTQLESSEALLWPADFGVERLQRSEARKRVAPTELASGWRVPWGWWGSLCARGTDGALQTPDLVPDLGFLLQRRLQDAATLPGIAWPGFCVLRAASMNCCLLRPSNPALASTLPFSVSGFWQKSCGRFSAAAMNCCLLRPSNPALASTLPFSVSGFR